MTCSEIYDLDDPDYGEQPIQVCGECGGDFFVNRSDNPLKGFLSLEHYLEVRKLVPRHLTSALDSYLDTITWNGVM
ncbi:MAG: hypothetical protein KJ879_03345 [Nanoarchaeota archaeon]|nr:hypothetical protein [Nanoarchaeota archaeon]